VFGTPALYSGISGLKFRLGNTGNELSWPRILLYSSVPSEKCRDRSWKQATTASFHVLSKLLLIRCHEDVLLDCDTGFVGRRQRFGETFCLHYQIWNEVVRSASSLVPQKVIFLSPSSLLSSSLHGAPIGPDNLLFVPRLLLANSPGLVLLLALY
jgi:hypothetical protein